MEASAKQKSKKFDQSEFKKVLKYYKASKTDESTDDGDQLAYCHLTGWHPTFYVMATHLVPESLQSEEVSYLFGWGKLCYLISETVRLHIECRSSYK